MPKTVQTLSRLPHVTVSAQPNTTIVADMPKGSTGRKGAPSK